MGATANTALGWAEYPTKKTYGWIKKQTKDILGLNPAPTPPEITPTPAPPSAFDAANAGAQAMSDAARRYRRQRGGGLSSTTINGAAGDPSAAPTFRKQLLGR